jgi:molybdopterin converting factor subunit 1
MTDGDLVHDYGGNGLGIDRAKLIKCDVAPLSTLSATELRFGWAGMPAPHRHRQYKKVRMQIRVLFFGVLKDMVGCASDTLELADGANVRTVLQHYSRGVPRFAGMLGWVALAVNQEYATVDAVLRAGDEVALLPPVSGGSPDAARDDVRVVRQPIVAQAVISGLKMPQDGAAVIFDGVVRDNTRGRRTLYLDYEAYEGMALKKMQGLAEGARSRFGVRQVALVHRLGRLEVGETSVLIAVASAHRGPAFEACRWIIDTLKKTVPIWKKEYFEDGAVWADGEPFPEEIRRPAGTAGGPAASK